MNDRPLRFFPIAFGWFAELQDLNVKPEVDGVAKLLAEFGAESSEWDWPMDERGLDAVANRLIQLQNPPEPSDTFLYWLGHGWSDGLEASLANAMSPQDFQDFGVTGTPPNTLAAAITNLQAHRHSQRSWAIVVIDACRSAQFVRLLSSELDRKLAAPSRLLLIGVSGEGATRLGEFRHALEHVVNNTFRATDIPFLALAEALGERLPGSVLRPIEVAGLVLRRRTPVPTRVPLDVFDQVKAALAGLSPAEQLHFIPKAQGAELGEIAWYFEGRKDERHAASEWLRTSPGGLMVVTGPAGSGKSALLGHLLEQSRPELRKVLVDAGLTDPVPDLDRPPENAFDAVVHLTGLTATGLLRQLADAFGFEDVFEDIDDGRRVATFTETFIRRLHARGGTSTILLDALDEAHQPVVVAREVIRQLGRVSGVRVLVGTRASTLEGPDHPAPGARDLLDALGPAVLVPVDTEPAAVTRYVAKRLRAQLPPGVEDQRLIGEISEQIGNHRRQFLFARLAVYEVLAQPRLLADPESVASLVASDHRDLFAKAVQRLAGADPAYGSLLVAQGLAMGRGMPILGDVWGTAARALDPSVPVTDQHIDDLLNRRAAPYLTVDVEHDQTVYRLAHATFAEHFRSRPEPARQRRLVAAFIALAERDRSENLNPYLRTYLPEHVASAGPPEWQRLAEHSWTLDRLDPTAVATNAMRSLFGRHGVPPEIAGVIGAQHLLRDLRPAERLGNRQFAMALYGRVSWPRPVPNDRELPSAWSIRWSRLMPSPLHLTLPSSDAGLRALVVVSHPDGRRLLAAAGDAGHIDLWDPVNGHRVGEDMQDGWVAVRAMTTYYGPDGRALLASGHSDGGVRIWDPFESRLLLRTLSPEPNVASRRVESITTVTSPDGSRRLLLVGDSSGRVRILDATTGEQFGTPLWAGDGDVIGLAVVPQAGAGDLLVTSTSQGYVRSWRFDGATAVPIRTYTDKIIGRSPVTPLRARSGETWLAYGDHRNSVTVISLNTGKRVGKRWPRHTSKIWALTQVDIPMRRELLALADEDRRITLRDATTGRQVGEPLTGPTGVVRTLVSFPGPDGRTMLASASADGQVRVWDLAVVDQRSAEPTTGQSRITAIAAPMSSPDQSLLASLDENGELAVWDTDRSAASGPMRAMAAHRGSVRAMTTFTDIQGRELLTAVGPDRTVRTWLINASTEPGDPPATDAPPQRPHQRRTYLVTGRTGGAMAMWNPATGDFVNSSDGSSHEADSADPVLAATAFETAGRETLLASGCVDGSVHLWSPCTERTTDEPVTVHSGRVLALTAVPAIDGTVLLVSGSADGEVRVVDPGTGAVKLAVGALPGVAAVAASAGADGTAWIAWGGFDGTIGFLDAETGEPVASAVQAHTGRIFALATFVGAEGTLRLASGGADGLIRVWDPTSGTPVDAPSANHAGAVLALTPIPAIGAGYLASSGADGTVRLWSPEGRPVGKPFTSPGGRVLALAAFEGQDGRPLLAGTGTDGVIRIWDTVSGLQAGEIDTGHTGSTQTLVAHAMPSSAGTTSSKAATATCPGPHETLQIPRIGSQVLDMTVLHRRDSSAQLVLHVPHRLIGYGLPTGEPRVSLDLGRRSTRNMIAALSTSRGDFAATVLDRDVRVHDLVVPNRPSVRIPHPAVVTALATLPVDERCSLLVTGAADWKIRVWDIHAPDAPLHTMSEHTSQIRAIVATTDDIGRPAVASAGTDQTICLWTLDSQTPVRVIQLQVDITGLARTRHGIAAVTTAGLVEFAVTIPAPGDR